MDKFHINEKGEPGACKAKSGGCPFGSDEEHFITVKDARESYEKSNEDNTFAPPTVRKNTRSLIKNRNTSPEVFMELANDGDKTVRIDVAESDHCPKKALALLSEDKDWEVREAVARNERTTTDVLEKLTNDENRDVMLAVIHNGRTPIEALYKLAAKTDFKTRAIIASDVRIFDYLLELSKDEGYTQADYDDYGSVIEWLEHKYL